MPAPAGKTALNGAEGGSDSDMPSVAVGDGTSAANAGVDGGDAPPPLAGEDGTGPAEIGIGDIDAAVPDRGTAAAGGPIGDMKAAPMRPCSVAGKARAACGAGGGVTLAALAACARASLMAVGAPGTADGMGAGALNTIRLEADAGEEAAAGAGSATWGTAPSAPSKAPEEVIPG